MSTINKFTNEEIAEIVQSEGLDYAIMYYMNEDSVSDPKLAELWAKARAILGEIESLIYPDGSNGDFEECV